jgi:anti-sigma regulatory factor (Ser/Thr protein kinase)
VTAESTDEQRYVHEALFFDTDESLLGEGLQFVSEGLRQGEDVALICTADRNQLLRDAAMEHNGHANGRLTLIDQRHAYRHASGALEFFRRLAAKSATDGIPRARVVGEVPFGRNTEQWAEWRRFESMANVALAPHTLWSVCAYDTRNTAPELHEIIRKTHPILSGDGRRGHNAGFVDPAAFLEDEPEPGLLPVQHGPPVTTIVDIRTGEQLREARQQLTRSMASVPGLPTGWARDFVLAVNELLENALIHGRSPVSVRLWVGADDVVCSVTDQGPGFRNPFAGYWRGLDTELAHHGLWLARQLCDEVSFHWHEGFTARARLALR